LFLQDSPCGNRFTIDAPDSPCGNRFTIDAPDSPCGNRFTIDAPVVYKIKTIISLLYKLNLFCNVYFAFVGFKERGASIAKRLPLCYH
jgi:hypothetical protein